MFLTDWERNKTLQRERKAFYSVWLGREPAKWERSQQVTATLPSPLLLVPGSQSTLISDIFRLSYSKSFLKLQSLLLS